VSDAPATDPTAMSAGYSGTPLVRKLGLKEGMSALSVDPPSHYEELLADQPDGVRWHESPSAPLDFVHLFVVERAGLRARLEDLRARLADAGMIWVSWPKKASGVACDVDGNVVRSAGLEAGLVDIKVCAVDETWSGLKFVIPTRERGRPAQRSRSRS